MRIYRNIFMASKASDKVEISTIANVFSNGCGFFSPPEEIIIGSISSAHRVIDRVLYFYNEDILDQTLILNISPLF